MRDAEFEYASNAELDDEPVYDLPQIDFADVLPFILEADELYLKRQRQYQSRHIFDSIKLGCVKMLTGKRIQASLEIYVRIAAYVSRAGVLSNTDATDLIVLMKSCSHINGAEIPLPSKYVYIRDKLMSSMKFLLPEGVEVDIQMPEELFGSEASKMPPAKGVYCNILESAGKQT